MLIAHVSDLHIGSSPTAADRTRRVAQYLDGLTEDPAAIIVTGDVADHGTAQEYREALQLLAGKVPVFCCPGNHDRRGAFEKILLGESVGGGPVNRVRKVPGATFLMCDSTVPGANHGALSPATLEWIEAQLGGAPADDRLLMALHHPPAALGIPFVDEILLRNPSDLGAVLARSRPVDALLCGHAHAASANSLGLTPVRVAPGVASTSRLPFELGAPSDDSLPPGLALHLLEDAAPLTTHFRMLSGDAAD